MRDICQIVPVTSGPSAHNHAYPTCRTWSRDGRQVFVESSGPSADDVSHVQAADIETGEIRDIVDLGQGCHGFDYAPDASVIVYIDAGGHELRVVSLDTMKSGLVFEEPEGTICGPPTISRDGTRVAYWCMFPSVANRFFDDYITAIMALDIDPVSCEQVAPSWVVEAYPRRKTGQWAQNPKHGIHVNHPQINPIDKDHICYSHEMRGATPDGSPAMCRLWQVMADGDQNRYLVRQPAGLHFTHEVIAPDGKSLIFPYMHGVGQVDFGTFERRSLYYNPDCCPGHLTVSPDGQWIAGDTWGEWFDDEGNRLQSIMMFSVKSREFAHLCWMPMSHGHPTHPHPNFSPDGAKIAFSMLVDGVCQVAYVDVTEAMANWDDLAHGVGQEVSPKWR